MLMRAERLMCAKCFKCYLTHVKHSGNARYGCYYFYYYHQCWHNKREHCHWVKSRTFRTGSSSHLLWFTLPVISQENSATFPTHPSMRFLPFPKILLSTHGSCSSHFEPFSKGFLRHHFLSRAWAPLPTPKASAFLADVTVSGIPLRTVLTTR